MSCQNPSRTKRCAGLYVAASIDLCPGRCIDNFLLLADVSLFYMFIYMLKMRFVSTEHLPEKWKFFLDFAFLSADVTIERT